MNATPAQERVVRFDVDYKTAFDPRSIPGVSIGFKEHVIELDDPNDPF